VPPEQETALRCPQNRRLHSGAPRTGDCTPVPPEQETALRCSQNRRLREFQSRSERFGEEKNNLSLPRFFVLVLFAFCTFLLTAFLVLTVLACSFIFSAQDGTQKTYPGGIRTLNPSKGAATSPRLSAATTIGRDSNPDKNT
jgi:hypothetical protein